jgi:hypothetical protein
VVKIAGYDLIVEAIIEQIGMIIGPVARTQANTVAGLHVNKKITIKGDPENVIRNLIRKYQRLMGPVAVTIAKKGVEPILKKNPGLNIPNILK